VRKNTELEEQKSVFR